MQVCVHIQSDVAHQDAGNNVTRRRTPSSLDKLLESGLRVVLLHRRPGIEAARLHHSCMEQTLAPAIVNKKKYLEKEQKRAISPHSSPTTKNQTYIIHISDRPHFPKCSHFCDTMCAAMEPAPALSPKIITRFGSPPNAAILVWIEILRKRKRESLLNFKWIRAFRGRKAVVSDIIDGKKSLLTCTHCRACRWSCSP